jgi:hypothetical protein
MKIKCTAPRNPFAVAAKNRKAGSHRKSNKALRREQKMLLKNGKASGGFVRDSGSGTESSFQFPVQMVENALGW